MDLPEGFTATPSTSPTSDLPPGFTASPSATDSLPEGFSATPLPEPPPGFTYQSPLTPEIKAAQEKSNLETPGFWSAVGSAFGRNFTQNVTDAIGGAQTLLPEGWGGKSLEQQYQEGLVHPATQDEITRLQQQSFFDGMTDPKWYGVHFLGGIGGALPGAGVAALGGLVGGGPGAAIGFGGEAGISTIVPAYKAARAAGLDPNDAVNRALIDTGIAASAATAMGLAPGISLFGRASEEAAAAAANVMKRPVLEALAQIGLVQPLIGDTAHIATALTHGDSITKTLAEIPDVHIDNMGMGAAMVGAHTILAESARAAKLAIPAQPPASPERVQESFQNQDQTTPPPSSGAPPTPPPLPTTATDRELFPREHQIFYSPVRKAIEEKVPDNASASQVLATIRNTPGVKEEELRDLNLPNYLEGIDGKVNKADLLAHVEANSLVLIERHQGTPTEFAANSIPPTEGIGVYQGHTLPGDFENYREIILRTPEKGTPQPVVDENLKPRPDVTIPDREQNFVGGHFGLNTVAHIRVTDRLDRDGKRSLHIEEIQSDWHQAGRKYGYKEEKSTIAELEREVKRMQDEIMRGDSTLDTGLLYINASRRLEAARNGIVSGPFRTSWPELAIKRMLRYAADNGYERITWANGDQIGLRQASPEQLAGSREFYDKIVPSIMKKWAKKLAMQSGETKFGGNKLTEELRNTPAFQRQMRNTHFFNMGLRGEINDRNGYVDVSPAAGERIRRGLPLYEEPIRFEVNSQDNDRARATLNAGFAVPIEKTFRELAQKLGMKFTLSFRFAPMETNRRGSATYFPGGRGEIFVNTLKHQTKEELYQTAAHEFGHMLMWDRFARSSDEIKTSILSAYEQWRKTLAGAKTVGDIYTQRDNAVATATGIRNNLDNMGKPTFDFPLSEASPSARNYLVSFEEWFAEQVARWATTDSKPLSISDKFFKAIGDGVRKILSTFQERYKINPRPSDTMQRWLDSIYKDDNLTAAADIKDKLEFDTQRQNQTAIDRQGTPEVQAAPQTASTGGGRNILNTLPPGPDGASGRDMAAHADRMNKFWEWMTSLPQIADANKHIRGLQDYKEFVALMNVEKNNILGGAKNTLDFWKKLADPRQQVALGKFIDDYMNGLFKDPSDKSGTVRRPTAKEFADLAKKHGLSKQALDVFDRLVRDFDGMLERYRQQLILETKRIKDPVAQMDALKRANASVDAMKAKPYFPAMRFGNFTITVYDAKGNVKHFETTETARKQRQIAEELKNHPNLLPGDNVRTGMLQKDVTPLMGMPPGMLDLMADKLQLSGAQRNALDQLRFEYAPAQSFRHRFQKKDLTPGYSSDWQRAYANYFFHGANHFTRVKYADKLRDQIRAVKQESMKLLDANKRDQIANYMTEHMGMLLDPKPDFAALRGLMFHWYLGFNPASATLNLSQTLLMTYPHLASKFGGFGKGDVYAAKAMLRASTDLNNFYKKGNLVERADAMRNVPGPEAAGIRALGEAVKEGIITETQAHVLAAISENRNLLRKFGKTAEDGWFKFSNASSWMFEMTEQYNRRVAFRAAWQLAMREPNNKYVQETVRDNPLQYQRLRDQGWSHQEASAFVAAKDSVEKTQFVYAPYSRPKFMWGRKGALFIFKSFTQNTLFNLYNNPAMAARSLLILAAVGGLMGLPGTEDINGILKAIAWGFFKKDFDVEDEARKFAIDVTNGTINPDMLLHGTSVKGWGIPAVADMLGHMVGVSHVPVPVLDRHGSVSMGNILPFEPGKMFGPSKDTKAAELQQIGRASGAGFSLGFSLYNFLQNAMQGKMDLKTWESIMPRAMSNVSHAFRFATQGNEHTQSGAAIARFNVTDTEQMAEILARAMGYQPRRITAQYESFQGKNEAATYWDLRKQILMRQFAAALQGGDPDEKARAINSIKSFNQELPDEWKPKAITAQSLRESITNRFRDKTRLEEGIALQRQNVKAFKDLDKYYPDAKPPGAVGVQQVK